MSKAFKILNFCFHRRSDALVSQRIGSVFFLVIGLQTGFRKDKDKEKKKLIDIGFWFLDIKTLLVFLRIGSGLIVFTYQSTSATKVVWQSMVSNGRFALFSVYGNYTGISK